MLYRSGVNPHLSGENYIRLTSSEGSIHFAVLVMSFNFDNLFDASYFGSGWSCYSGTETPPLTPLYSQHSSEDLFIPQLNYHPTPQLPYSSSLLLPCDDQIGSLPSTPLYLVTPAQPSSLAPASYLTPEQSPPGYTPRGYHAPQHIPLPDLSLPEQIPLPIQNPVPDPIPLTEQIPQQDYTEQSYLQQNIPEYFADYIPAVEDLKPTLTSYVPSYTPVVPLSYAPLPDARSERRYSPYRVPHKSPRRGSPQEQPIPPTFQQELSRKPETTNPTNTFPCLLEEAARVFLEEAAGLITSPPSTISLDEAAYATTSLPSTNSLEEAACFLTSPPSPIYPVNKEKKAKALQTVLKRPKRKRIEPTDTQRTQLELVYSVYKYLGHSVRIRVADEIGLPEKSVLYWFQNRRAREKKAMKNAEKKQ